MTDFISIINEWCQKNKCERPTFTFIKPDWSVCVSANWLKQDILAEGYASKKAAKQACCEYIVTNLIL